MIEPVEVEGTIFDFTGDKLVSAFPIARVELAMVVGGLGLVVGNLYTFVGLVAFVSGGLNEELY